MYQNSDGNTQAQKVYKLEKLNVIFNQLYPIYDLSKCLEEIWNLNQIP